MYFPVVSECWWLMSSSDMKIDEKVPAELHFWLSHDQRSPTELIYSEYKTSGFESKKGVLVSINL